MPHSCDNRYKLHANRNNQPSLLYGTHMLATLGTHVCAKCFQYKTYIIIRTPRGVYAEKHGIYFVLFLTTFAYLFLFFTCLACKRLNVYKLLI